VSADRDRLAAIRARHEAMTHPDWRDVTTVGVLLTALDQAGAEAADLREALTERRTAARKLAEHADEVTAERDAALAEAGALRDKLVAVTGLLADLTDPGECWYDHHGYCQEHGWFDTDPRCPHARAKALLPKEDQQ
jgi:hypothetical protein